jgi:Domain of unknown function (DUF4082)/Cadherin-like domain/Bacterial Ig domain
MASNPIVIENQKTGTAQAIWDLSGPAATNIEGFATSISVNSGSPIGFKINTDSTNYRIDIYRLGYYGGLGACFVTTIQQNTASVQPPVGGDPTIGLYDAADWNVTATWTVPPTAVSGVYIAKLTRQDATAGESHIVFVVRNDGTNRDIVFKTSDTTWHAYNGWGGANLYGGNATASPDGRAYKVSYNRPFGTRDGIGTFAGPQDFVFSGEYAAIRWLERNGFDVTYIASIDAEPGNVPLTNYKVFISVGHDEYWSGDLRTSVEAARDAGVHLIFMSGNEVYWKTRWEADSNGTPNRILVCYKETHANAKIDPTPTWTGTWRDPTFSPPSDGGRPENALTGTIYQVDSYRGDTITVPSNLAQFRFWRNTAVQAGTTNALAPGMLGYEWDEAPDNGFRPGGLIFLSSTTIQVESYLLDYGNTTGNGTATHHLALYRAPSGAIVFGTGTVFLSFGLDTDHDYANDDPDGTLLTPVDPNVQQAMVNLFADMGVQPQTLQSGLVAASASTDHTPPISIISTPAAGASLVQQQPVSISGTASDSGGLVAVVEVSTDGGTTWHPATGTTSWTYTWWPLLPGTFTIRSRAVDDSLNMETPAAGVTVTVTPAATLSLFTPADTPFAILANDPLALELGVHVQINTAGTVSGIRFYKDVQNTGPHIGNFWSASGTLLATATFTGETASGWQQVNFSTPVSVTAGTTYVASYHTASGFYSSDQNYFYNTRTVSALVAPGSGANGVFTYGSASAFPANTNLNANYWVDLVLNRAGGAGNLPPIANNDSGFTTLKNTVLSIPAASLLANDSDPNGYTLSITGVSSPVDGTVAYNATTQVVSFTPTTGYTGSASFVYAITNGHGGTASATVSLTVTATGTVSLFPAGTTPANITANDANAIELGVKFEASVAGQILGILFYKGPQNTGTHIVNLWSSTGTLLASATSTDETASGWQTVSVATPVSLTANTIYVASYHTGGFYSIDDNYFVANHVSGVLTAPSSASSGGNGVYTYGTGSSFPTSTFNASNYWVDVIFDPSGTGNLPPVANNDSGFTTPLNSVLAIPAASVLANDSDPNGFTISVSGVSSPVNGTVSYNTTTQVISFTPTTGYLGAASFVYTITNGHGGTASATVSLTVVASSTVSLFPTSATPANITVNDSNAVELGVKFETSVAGQILGILFYKGPQNIGTHVVNLWSSTGTLLASATAAMETASGWQTVMFATPVTLTANTIYVASYHCTGFYSVDNNYFTNSVASGVLTAPSSASSGGNGVYVYGTSSSFPTNTFNASNYWVDVIFSTTGT